jgi:hypothetical protein
MKSFLILIGVIYFSLSSFAYRPIDDIKLTELLQSFDYTPQVLQKNRVAPSCKGQDVEFETNYPQRDTNLPIKAKFFIPPTTSEKTFNPRFPIVFVLPPLGGANRLDLMLSETLCKNNIASMLIVTSLTGLESQTLVPVSDHDHTHRRVVSAIKGGLIVASTYSQINTEKVGLFGASLGGILGSVAYSVMPQISAASFLVNGGDVAHILAQSDQELIIKLKNQRMKEQGFTTVEQYENFLNENLEIDPLHFSKLIPADSVKLYLSQKDQSVPSEKQLLYYESLERPKETRFYQVGHAQTIFAVMGINNQRQAVADWYLSRFALPNPRALDFAFRNRTTGFSQLR